MANANLLEISRFLIAGLPVVIPTDTVLGLAMMVTASGDPQILFTIKDRPVDKSIPWLIGSLDDLDTYTSGLPDWALSMAERFWPGALTLVCRASSAVPPAFAAPDGSIALRMPNHPLALELLHTLAAPLACTSANISGQEPVSRVSELDPRIAGRVAGVLDDSGYGPPGQALPSTIVSCLGDGPEVLRKGDLTLDELLSGLRQQERP